MPTETRYMRTDHFLRTVNTLVAHAGHDITDMRDLAIKVFKVSGGGVETEISGGGYVALVTNPDYPGAWPVAEYHGTWVHVAIALAATDQIRVKAYHYFVPTTTWTLMDTWTTDDAGGIGASQLDANTWDVYYHVYWAGLVDMFGWGSAALDSRIENFQWSSEAAAATPVKRFIKMDAGPHPRSRSLYRYKMKKWVSIVANKL